MKAWLESRLSKTCPVNKETMGRPASVGPANRLSNEATIKPVPRSAISHQQIVTTNQCTDDSNVGLTSKIEDENSSIKENNAVYDRPKSCVNYVKDFDEKCDYFITSSPNKSKSETQLHPISNMVCRLGIDPYLIGISDERIVRAEVYHYDGDSCSDGSDRDDDDRMIKEADVNSSECRENLTLSNGNCDVINNPPEVEPVNDLMKTLRCNSVPNDGDYRNSPFSDSGFRSKYSPSPKECPIADTPLYHPHTKEPYITPSDPPIGLPPPHPALLNARNNLKSRESLPTKTIVSSIFQNGQNNIYTLTMR